ncbi:CIC11C00000000799 [Sungouiella intermedia]|uniref:CIC11C00000000799 n=1 Tax=Sungouiella intermedia TaxID=45354 RepID=A0A1L0CUE1_9ASCO|nr:CIC11C00000000799 [[Candida] intermedia]
MAPKRAAESESSTDFSKELDKKKSVTVRQFNGMNLVDIREFYIDKVSGEKKPGKKGIALSESAWKELVRLLDEVNDALDALNGGKRKKVEEKPDQKPDEKKKEEENDEKEKDEEREGNIKERTVKTEEE